MKAPTWHGKGDMRCETVPDPTIQDGRDAIIKVTACAICGSDLHLFDGVMPSMEKGDIIDRVKMAAFLGTDRPHVLRQCITNTRNFGIVSVIGVYGGLLDKIPMGSAMNRGLTFKMSQTSVQHYLPKLLRWIEEGKIDPSFVITHRAMLEDGPGLYETFRDKKDGCIEVVLTP